MHRRLFTAEKILLSCWLAVNLLTGALIVHDFGVSFDEPRYYQYATQSVDAYKSWFAQAYEPDYGPANLRFYGPSYILFVELILRGLRLIRADIPAIEVWHFSYFLLFQLTGLCLYLLARRWFRPATAWFMLIMFITQPLLWGHSFMNPKDIPFMAFVTFSIFLGFRMADSWQGEVPQLSLQGPLERSTATWNQIAVTDRKKVLSLLAVGFVVLILTPLFNYLIERAIIFFYTAAPASLAGKAFRYFADRSSTAPVADYVAYAQSIFSRFAFVAVGLVLLATAIRVLPLLSKSKSVKAALQIQSENQGSPANWRTFLLQMLRALGSGKVILAGIALGLTISIRVVGPLPGLLIGIYVLWKNRQQALTLILPYLCWAFLTTYITWPFLWISPVRRYMESLVLMVNFPWPGRVLFNGHFYRPDRLPFDYLPVLMNIQFTEPVLILFYLGLLAILFKLFVRKVPVDMFLFVTLGFVLPLVGFLVLGTPLYDNFRQLFFLIPPIFVLAGYGFELVTDRLSSNFARVLLIALCASPGIYSIVQLHPYQYVYYNSLVGGVHDAARRFELDYWRTSYREIALQVNKLASPEAKVFVSGAPFSYLPYNRPDIVVENKIDPERPDGFELAVLTSRWNTDENLFPEAKVVYVVERDGAVLSVLKQIKETSLSSP